jgi:hypothetical protein
MTIEAAMVRRNKVKNLVSGWFRKTLRPLIVRARPVSRQEVIVKKVKYSVGRNRLCATRSVICQKILPNRANAIARRIKPRLIDVFSISKA